MKLRGIVIDDEYLARQRLIKLTEEVPEISIVAECRNGKEAVKAIRLKEPDFIFLDIQMPDMDGFKVLDQLDELPYVIFTTAYDSFALKAFEINAVDYLLKPFDEERLVTSIQRMKALKKNEKAGLLEEKINRLISDYRNEQINTYRTNFEIKRNGRFIKIAVESIFLIKSDGNYLELFSEKGKYLYRCTMNTVENELSPLRFLRIHRTMIVNCIYIDKIKYQGNSVYKITLKNGEIFYSGRSYRGHIQDYLKETDG